MGGEEHCLAPERLQRLRLCSHPVCISTGELPPRSAWEHYSLSECRSSCMPTWLPVISVEAVRIRGIALAGNVPLAETGIASAPLRTVSDNPATAQRKIRVVPGSTGKQQTASVPDQTNIRMTRPPEAGRSLRPADHPGPLGVELDYFRRPTENRSAVADLEHDKFANRVFLIGPFVCKRNELPIESGSG